MSRKVTDRIRLTASLYDEAANERKTLSQLLEEKDPSPQGSKLDAFERLLREHGIVVKSDYERGTIASEVDAFYRTEESKVLFPEFIARTVREALVRDTILPSLVGSTITINTDSYRSFYVDDQPEKQQLRRVTEAAELPRVTIRGREQVVRLWKYGRAIEASYEVIRRMQIDMLALHIRRIAMQIAKDKAEEALYVIKNGDGNENRAPEIKMSDLVSGATDLTPEILLRFMMEFEEFGVNTLISSKKTFANIVAAHMPDITTSQLLALIGLARSSGITISTPQFPDSNLTLLWHDSIDDSHIYGINREFAIQEVKEAGSDIRESTRFIMRQTEALTISENVGFAKIFDQATKILVLE